MIKFTKQTAVAAALVATVAAAGAGLWWAKKPAVQKAGGSGVLVNVSAEFAVNNCQPRLHDDKPALAVVFSDLVKADQPLEKLIQVSDLGEKKGDEPNKKQDTPAVRQATGKSTMISGGWIVTDNPHVIVFPFVKPGHQYKVTLSAALTAASGKQLGQSHSCDMLSDPMSPSFFFASKGTVLPAGLNGGLPVVTVNVPEVDVEFLRVSPDKMSAFLDIVAGKPRGHHDEESDDESGNNDYYDRSSFKGQVYGYQLDQLQGLAQSVYTNRFLTSDAQNSRKVSLLPVEKIAELSEPGIYVAVMRRPGEFGNDYQVTYFYTSDIGLHARRQVKQTDVFTTSLKTGKGQGDVELEVIDGDGKVLARGKTDGDGHGVLPGLPDKARLLLARRGKETSIIALREAGLDLSEFDIGGHLPRDVKLFAYAGRDLYRPGEKFTVSLLARSADGAALPPVPIKAELKKPDGDVVSSTMWQPDLKTPGYLQRAIELPADAATGKWSLELRADPAARRPDAIVSFQVEEFLPERMKLTLNSAPGTLDRSDNFAVDVQGDYLYGAPAAGNRLLGSASQERARNPLPKEWPGFQFGDADDDKNVAKRVEMDEQALSDEGKATVDVPFDPIGGSPLRVRAAFSLLESGGRPVVRSVERMVWPARQLIAVRPAFEKDVAREGSTAEFEVIRTNAAGKLVPLKQAPFRLIREDRQYYWRYDKDRGWHSGFSESFETVQSGVLDLSERAKLTVPVQWGRYLLELSDPQTGLKTRYRFYAGWNAQDADSLGNRPDRVRLQLEGAPVKPGDDVKLKIMPPHDGEALVLVEADKVLWSKRVSVSTAGTTVSIPVDKDWKRSDMYVSTVVFRPGSQGDRVTPARAVGMTWLPLAREARKLKVAVTAPAQVEPEKRAVAKVKVDGAAGKRVLVTLSAVDVGILNITSFATPDPFDFFFGKHRFGPELSDIYGKLIERLDGAPGKLKWGGDAGKRDTRSMPKKVKLIDLFSGPVYLNDKGEADIALMIPDFNGTLRLMAVASTDEGYGHADREMTVSAPIVAEIAMPRFIGPGDSAALALDVTNMMAGEQDISVKLGTDRLLRLADGERSVKLKPRQRSILRFNVEATEPYGLARVTLDVKTGGARPVAIHREFALQVQPPLARESEGRRVRIEPGASATLDTRMLERFHRASSTLSMTLSNKPPINVRSIVKGLLDYPYGCLEQTTSAAYPHVFIDEAGAKAVGLEPRTREQRARVIEGAIGRIAGMQGAAGGYHLWSASEGSYEAWLTPYVTGFLMDAREAGFSVPEAMNKRAQTWMVERLNGAANQFTALPRSLKADANGRYNHSDYELLRNSHQRFAELAYIGYMLAREQKASLASLRLLHDQYRDRARSPLPLVHLGIALALMGDAKRSQAAIADAMTRPYGIHSGYMWDWMGDYGSAVRDQAMSYALLVRHKIEHPQRETMLTSLAEQLGERRYYSTQERIALFMAARAAGGSSSEAWKAQYKAGDSTVAAGSKDSEVRSLDPAMAPNGVIVENKGSTPLWVELEGSGFPLKMPAPSDDKIALKRQWYGTDGKPWKGGPLKVGDMLLVRLTASSKEPIEDALVVDHIPAGLEVENQNLSAGPQAGEFTVDGVNLAQATEAAAIKHKEYRDDRFVAALKLDGNVKHLFYMLRVVTPGRFQVPGTFAEDMYRPHIRAHGAAPEPVTVTDPRGAGK